MKICLLTHTFPRSKDDFTAPFMDGLASGLVDLGNDVWVLAPFTSGFQRQNDPYKIVTYRYMPFDFLHKIGYSRTLTNDMGVPWVMYLLSPFMYVSAIIALLSLIKREKIEVINAHWILPNGFIAAVASKITGVPVVSTLPGSDVYMVKKNFLFRLMGRFAANQSSAITSNSGQLLEDLKNIKITNTNLRTVIYGVNPAKFRPDKEAASVLRKKYNIHKDKVIVLAVGRLVEKKGFIYLVEAAPEVVRKNPSVVFFIIGEGDQRGELEMLIRDLKVDKHFLLPGWVDYKHLPEYYNLADIFILPSVRDSQGNLDDQSVAVVEAMACGKAIVTSDFPGYRKVVAHGINGYLTKEGSSQEIAKALIKLVSSRKLRVKMGKVNRKLAQEELSWKAIGKEYTELFTELIVKNHYSQSVPKILNVPERIEKSKQILGILEQEVSDMKSSICLDIGCSSGVITNEIAKKFKRVIGIDVDPIAIKEAKENFKSVEFIHMKGNYLDFPNAIFDVVVLNQVYEFAEDPKLLASEIFRVLKPGGVCFVGARNKLALIEGQTGLPFIHLLPQFVTKIITQSFKVHYYPANYMTFERLTDLFFKFKINDITLEVLANPKKYNFTNIAKYESLVRKTPTFLLKIAHPFIPNYLLVLRKTI